MYPALRAGVQTHLLLSSHRANLMQLLDNIGQCLVVYDVTGRMVHETPQLASMLTCDPDAAAVRLRLSAFHTPGAAYEFNTATAAYAIRTFLYSAAHEGSCTVACVDRKTPLLMTDRDLYATFGLTPAEIRVARAISEGMQNAAIAERLYLSPHTVRRHTERVLHKLAVCARTEVRGKVIAR